MLQKYAKKRFSVILDLHFTQSFGYPIIYFFSYKASSGEVPKNIKITMGPFTLHWSHFSHFPVQNNADPPSKTLKKDFFPIRIPHKILHQN